MEITVYQAIVIIENFQDWRLGANIKQPEPAVITKALTVLIATAKETVKHNKIKKT